MPRSMTGFARYETKIPGVSLTWELRSVNHRYLEAFFRLPEVARELETELREQLRKTLHRGKVEINLSIQTEDSDSKGSLDINLPLLRQLSGAIKTVESEASQLQPTTALELLKWPGVIAAPEQDREQLLDGLRNSFKEALKILVAHRQREGNEIQAMIEQRLDSISTKVVEVRELMPKIQQAQQG